MTRHYDNQRRGTVWAVRWSRMWKGELMDDDARVEELEATIRSLRDEVERLKSELSRLRRNLDERPPHYL